MRYKPPPQNKTPGLIFGSLAPDRQGGSYFLGGGLIFGFLIQKILAPKMGNIEFLCTKHRQFFFGRFVPLKRGVKFFFGGAVRRSSSLTAAAVLGLGASVLRSVMLSQGRTQGLVNAYLLRGGRFV